MNIPPKTYTTMVRFTEEQKRQIFSYCERTGTSISALLRMLLDDFFNKKGE